LTVHDTDIINFQSSYQGGINAILYTDNIKTSGSNSAIVTCKNVNFTNNRTTSYCDNGDGYTYGFSSNGAAALGVAGGRVELENCTFTNNWACRTAGAVDLRFQQYNKNKADIPVKIKNCVFSENQACGGHGGAIMINAVQGIIEITGTQFIKNEASGGGAIKYNSSTTTIFDVLNDKYKYPMRNHVGYGSEPLWHTADNTYNGNAYLLIETTCSFTSNLAKDVDFYGTYPAGGGGGGAIYATNNLRVKGAVFTDNIAKTSGGAIY
jgi:predicted outer membrane repeat protein